jgi:hypothetical protein
MTSGKKIPPAVTLGMAIVNKGNNKITELLNFNVTAGGIFSPRSLQLGSFT